MAPTLFDCELQLQRAIDYAATSGALFGSSDLSPLLSPDSTPPSSLTLRPPFETKIDEHQVGSRPPVAKLGGRSGGKYKATPIATNLDRMPAMQPTLTSSFGV